MRAALWLLPFAVAACARPDAPLTQRERDELRDPILAIGELVADSNYAAADSAAEAWLARHVDADAVGRVYEGRATYSDTLAAFLLARRAFVRWQLGDTAGTVAAYGLVLPYRDLLPDSTAGRVLRWMAWAAASGDPAEGLRLMDVAERWARERGLNREAAEIARCKAELLSRMRQGEPCPPEDVAPPKEPSDAGLLILAVAALLSLLGYLLGWRRREAGHGEPSVAAP